MQVKQLLTIPETTSRKDSLVGGTGGGGTSACFLGNKQTAAEAFDAEVMARTPGSTS